MEPVNPKYLSLRKKLDGLKFTEHLDPRSVDLVERIFNEYSKLLDRFKEPKKNVTPPTDNVAVAALNEQIDYLNDQNHKLRAEIDTLKTKSVATQQNNGVEEKIMKLNTTLHEYRLKYDEKVKEYNEEIRKLSEEVELLRLRNKQLQGQNQQLRSKASANSSQLEKYNAELSALIDKKNREIKEMQENSSKFRIKMAVMEKQIEQLTNRNQSLVAEESLQSTKLVQIMRSELADAEKKLGLCKTTLEEETREKELMKGQIRKLNEQINEYRMDGNRSKDIQSIAKNSKERLEGLYEEAIKNLAAKNEQVTALKQEKSERQKQIQRLNSKIKQCTTANKNITGNISQLHEEITMLSNKSTLQMKRIRELEGANAVLEKQLQEREQKEAVPPTAMYSEMSVSIMEEKHRKAIAVLEREIKSLNQSIQLYKQAEHKTLIDKERIVMENKKLETIISQGSKNLEILRVEKEELMKQNKQLRATKETVYQSDSQSRNEILRLKEKSQGFESHIEQLKSIIFKEQSNNKVLASQIAKLNSLISKSQQKNKQIFEDNKTMVMQIKMLQARKNQMSDKLRVLQEARNNNQKDGMEYRKEYEELAAQYDKLLADLRGKELAIVVVDNQRDELQNLVDQKTETIESLKIALQKMEKEYSQFNKGLNQREINLQSMQKRTQNMEMQKTQLEKDYNNLYEQYMEEKKKANKVETELKKLQSELEILMLGRGEGQKELDRAMNKNVQLDRRLKERTKQYDEEREKAAGLNLINSQLSDELQADRAELNRLKHFVDELSKQNNNMYNHLQNKDQQLQSYGMAMDDVQRKERQLLNEIASYQRQIQHLSQDLNAKESDIQRAYQQRDAFKAQRNWRKDSSAVGNQWKTMMEQRHYQLQQDYEAKRRQNDHLKVKLRDYQNMLADQRTKNFALSRKVSQASIKPVLHQPVLHEQILHENSVSIELQSSVDNWKGDQSQSEPDVSSNSEFESVSSKDIRMKMEQMQKEYSQLFPSDALSKMVKSRK